MRARRGFITVGGKQYASDQGTANPHTDVAQGPAASQNGAQNLLGNAEVQDRLRGGGMDAACTDTVLPTPIPANGDLGYYRARHDDFASIGEGGCEPSGAKRSKRRLDGR